MACYYYYMPTPFGLLTCSFPCFVSVQLRSNPVTFVNFSHLVTLLISTLITPSIGHTQVPTEGGSSTRARFSPTTMTRRSQRAGSTGMALMGTSLKQSRQCLLGTPRYLLVRVVVRLVRVCAVHQGTPSAPQPVLSK